MAYIMSIYYGHTATACLMKDTEIIGIVSEERFTGAKGQSGLPLNSISYLLKQGNIGIQDIDKFVIPFQTTGISSSGNFKEDKFVSLNIFYLPYNLFLYFIQHLPITFKVKKKINKLFYTFLIRTIGTIKGQIEVLKISRKLKVKRSKISCFDHHLCHAASAYFTSPFDAEKTLVFTLDGEGDGLFGTITSWQNNEYVILQKLHRSSSLGILYSKVTQYLGMKPNEHEFKVMGLAPYAKVHHAQKVFKKLNEIFYINDKNEIASKIDIDSISPMLDKVFKGERFDNIAAGTQMLLEKLILKWIEINVKSAKIGDIACAGGVFMNVKLNQIIAEKEFVNSYWVVPSCGDESSGIGAAMLHFNDSVKSKKNKTQYIELKHLYLGEEAKRNEILKEIDELENSQFKIDEFKDPENEIANYLSDGQVVGRFCGRMEFGARALGNRSILANPHDFDVVRQINEYMKNRDFWMPFAPSIISEKMDMYVNVNPKTVYDFMMVTCGATEKGKKMFKAAMHPYDFTMRPQEVKVEINPKYYKLISYFGKKTGTYGVLNTSFNLHGYPIVRTPKDAIFAFRNSGLKVLNIENFIIVKRN